MIQESICNPPVKFSDICLVLHFMILSKNNECVELRVVVDVRILGCWIIHI